MNAVTPHTSVDSFFLCAFAPLRSTVLSLIFLRVLRELCGKHVFLVPNFQLSIDYILLVFLSTGAVKPYSNNAERWILKLTVRAEKSGLLNRKKHERGAFSRQSDDLVQLESGGTVYCRYS